MTKQLKSIGIATVIALAIVGCSGGADQGSSYAKQANASPNKAGLEAADAATAPGKDANESNVQLPRKIIYTGDIHLVCEDLNVASQKLESRIRDFGAYIGNASKTGSRGSTRESTWTIRLPAEKFDAFIKFATTIGELESNHREAQDVSEEYYDVQARLKNKKIEEARLVELLKRSTGKLSEVLTVEKELSRVREEAERIEGRLRFLQNQTDLSTITVTIKEVKNYHPEGPPNVKTQVSRSFNGSIDAMKELALGVLLIVVALLPWAIPLGLIAWVVVRKLRKPTRKPAREAVAPENSDPT